MRLGLAKMDELGTKTMVAMKPKSDTNTGAKFDGLVSDQKTGLCNFSRF